MVIKPTIGRVVWYRPSIDDIDPGMNPLTSLDLMQPFDAHVTYVHSDRMINIVGFDHVRSMFFRPSVLLLQEGDEKPLQGPYCEWMPYQVGQAKKHEGEGV